MLTEEDILPELEQYQKWSRAYMQGKDESNRPKLPENKDAPKYNAISIFGAFIHGFIFLALEISTFLRIKTFVSFFAKLRITTDKFSYEPYSCGYNNAYTKLRLVLLAKNDVSGAINCLNASWRVHPCPHNSSFGLKRALVRKLRDYPEAENVVNQYINIGKQFVYWADKWVEGIYKS